MGAVEERGLGEVRRGGAGAVEDDDGAAGRVGAAVVEVDCHGAGVALAGRDREVELGENAAARGAVRGVVWDCLGGRVRGDGEVRVTLIGAADEGALGTRGRGRDAGGVGHGAVGEGDLVDREVCEANALEGVVVSERRDNLSARPDSAAVVVEAHLPADEVLHVIDDEVGSVVVRDVTRAGRGGIDGTDRHRVGGVVVRGTGRGHVQADRRVLDSLRGQTAGKQKCNRCRDSQRGRRWSQSSSAHRSPLPLGAQEAPERHQYNAACQAVKLSSRVRCPGGIAATPERADCAPLSVLKGRIYPAIA